MKKKISIILTLVITISALFSINVFADDISVYVDSNLVELTDVNGNRVYPFIQNGTTYVPLRGISEVLDCDVIWDGYNKTILIYKEMQSDNSVFRNDSDEVKLYVDNQFVELKDANGTTVKPFIKEGTTYVPLRGVSQALGCWVRWNGVEKNVSAYMHTCPPDGVTLTENKPYELYCLNESDDTYYEDKGERLEIEGQYYTNALDFRDYISNKCAYFNLNGMFDTVKMTVGGHYGVNENDTILKFIVDGKIVDTYTFTPTSKVQDISVNLNKGMQLKIIITESTGRARLGNITFF